MKNIPNKKLAAKRKYFDISQEQIANEIGMTPKTFSNKEFGITDFKETEIVEILNFFRNKDQNIQVSDLFF